MNTSEELAAVRRRIGGVEHELEQLKRRVSDLEFEAQVAAETAKLPARFPRESAPIGELPPPLPVAKKLDEPPLMRTELKPAPAIPEKFQEPVRRPVVAPEPSVLERMRPWLERLQLWPPSGGGSKEVQLGAWWATRLGMVFAVIGAVFFGVYISLNTPPWVKLIELAAVAAGIVGLGRWLERKTPRFGQVVFAGGLALAFFTAMAAYTVPGVKVIDDRLVAALWQLAVTVGIGVVAWRRNSQPVATMAVLLGYVAAWFSFSGGLQLFALVSALGLAALAVGWKRWLAWDAPSLVALPGYWAIYATLLGGLGASGNIPLPAWVWGFVAGGFAVFFWRDDRAGRGGGEVGGQEAWVQNANSTAALVLGWLTAWFAFPAGLGVFYAAAAVVLGAAAWRRMTTARDDVAGAVLLAKALGALTLAVIKWTDPELTGLALMVQAGVMLVTNRRLRSTVIAAGAGIVAMVALCYWWQETFGQPAQVGSVKALGRVLTLAGFVAWGLEMARDCGVGLTEDSRRSLARSVSAVAALMALIAAQSLLPATWLPTWCVAGAVMLGVAGMIWKRVEPWLAAGAVLVAAHVAQWARLEGAGSGIGAMWMNAVVVLAPTVVGAWWLGRGGSEGRQRAVAWWVSLLAVVTLGACVCVGHGATASLLTGVGLAVALSMAAPWQPARNWLWLATWALGVGVIAHVVAIFEQPWKASGEVARWITALVALIGPAALAAWARGRERLAAESPRGGTQGLIVATGALFAVVVAIERQAMAPTLMVASGFALLASGLLTWVCQGAHRAALWAFTLFAGAVMMINTGQRMVPAILVAVAVAWAPALIWARSTWVAQRWRAVGIDPDVTITGQTWFAGVLTAVAIVAQTSAEMSVWWLAGATVVAMGLAQAGFRAVVEVATGFALLGLAHAALLVVMPSMVVSDFGSGFGAVVAIALVAASLPKVLPEGRLWVSAAMRTARAWIFPTAGLGLVFALMVGQRGELRPYVTVGWGVAALAWFGLGLFARERPDRLLGLVGLALCVPRVFLVDLNSTFHRIVAFGALGAVLLWVGFSYHRFRHLIADDAAPEPDETDKKL